FARNAASRARTLRRRPHDHDCRAQYGCATARPGPLRRDRVELCHPPLHARTQACAVCRDLRRPRAGRCVLQPRTCRFDLAGNARAIPAQHGLDARKRRSLEQTVGYGNAAGLAARARLRGCRLLLEMARAGASGRLQTMSLNIDELLAALPTLE